MTPWKRVRAPLLYSSAILGIGLAYRLSFIYQGWSATDEGWLQAAGGRIAAGQVPYRDFEFLLPPVTIYKEGALQAILGDQWTVLASRWLFSFEVSVASMLVFLILRRFVSDRAAFFTTLPTIFFSVTVLAFTNYTYDAEFCSLMSIALVLHSGADRRGMALALAAGAAAGLAAMSKTPFIAFLPAIPFAAIVSRRLRTGQGEVPDGVRSLQLAWPLYLVGAAIAIAAFFAYFALIGSLSDFTNEAFVLTSRANPVSVRFALIQDLPEYAVRFGRLGPGLVAIILLLLAVTFHRAWDLARTVLLAGALFFVLVYTQLHMPIPSRPYIINVAYFVVTITGLVALVLGVILNGPWQRRGAGASGWRSLLLPPELVFLALFMQWLAQFHYDGLVFWYMGSFLSVPAALLFLHAVGRARVPLYRSAQRLRFGAPAAAPVLLGLWLAIGGAGVFLERVYQDADRPALTGSFAASKLRGITTYPATADRVNGIVTAVDDRTAPGDDVFFFPDFGIMYEVTERTNPTPIDWYNEAFLTTATTSQVLAALQKNPPKVVFLQEQREGAYQRDQAPIDYAHSKWAPIYDWLVAHYTEVGTVQDIKVLVPS